jgi:hypothetical protein
MNNQPNPVLAPNSLTAGAIHVHCSLTRNHSYSHIGQTAGSQENGEKREHVSLKQGFFEGFSAVLMSESETN